MNLLQVDMMWPQGFASQPESPATHAELMAFVDSVFAPLTPDEIISLLVEHKRVVGDGHFDPPFDPTCWQLPKHRLPASYLNFLRHSNGGFFAGTNRNFDPLFKSNEVRQYMLGYSIPHWMPMSCPIGFDGGGSFYLLDMRRDYPSDDYPVLFAHAGNLHYDEAIILADSFAGLLQSTFGES